MKKTLKKIIATVLLACMMSANISTGITYALSENQISNQTSKTQDANVEFNAYFDGKVHSKTEKINSTAKLYLEIKVSGTGYLEKGVVSFKDTNFTISNNINNKNIQSIDTQNNKILLNKISSGSNEIIEIPVNILKSDEVSIDNFSKETKTVFTATYIDKNAKEKNVSKEIINKLSWDGITGNEVNAEIKAELTKYIPYSNSEKYAVIMQTKINSGIKNNALPIKETQLNIQVPEINNIKPTEVNVIANQTSATNGEKDGINFNQKNYTYNSQTGIVSIDTKNLANKISWLKNSKDEYLVTFVFEGKEVYDYVNENEVETNIKVNGNIQVYNEQEKTIKANEVVLPISAKQKVGDLVDYSLKSSSSIAKGQIYANYESKNKKETTYSLEYSAIVNSAKLTENIKFAQEIDNFVTENALKNSTTVAGNNYTYNKNIKINQKVFEKILGAEGSVDIYDAKGNKLGNINKNTAVEDGNYVLNIEELNNNQLSIVTSKPILEGKISVTIEKAIKTDINYTEQQLKTFKKLVTKLNDVTNEISLTEPESIVSVEVNKTDLTTVVENKNVEIRAILDTSNLNNALYENPTFNIKLPKYIAKFKLNSYDILMANGLKIKSVKPVEENGQVVVKVQLEGKQTEYTIDAQYKGTIVILNMDITAKTLTPTSKNKITVEYTNANDVTNKAKGTVETQLNFVAPSGVITANGISNYSNGAADLFSISDEGATGVIKAYSEKRIATVSGKIVNNYSNSVKDVKVLGRIPVQGNKTIETGKDLGSTFSTKLKSKVELKGVEASKYTVYYSDNANATKNLEDKSNNWSTSITENTQSYMIVMGDYEMKSGETIEISYSVEIPEKVSYNNNVNELYKVYYTNMSSIGEFVESKTSPIVTLTTGEGPDLSVELSTTTRTVREGQIVRMTATVKNVGSIDAKNVKLNLTAPDGTVHTEILDATKSYTDSKEKIKTISIGNLAIGQTVTKDYELRIEKGKKVETITDETTGETRQIETTEYPGDKEIECNANITADVLANEIKAEPCKLKVLEGDLAIVNIPSAFEYETLKKGKNIKYIIKLENISNSKDLENVTLNAQIPQGIKINDVYYSDDLNFKTKNRTNITTANNNVSVNIGKLENFNAYLNKNENLDVDTPQLVVLREFAYVCIDLEIESFTGELKTKVTAKADGIEEHCSNIRKYNVEAVKLTLQQKEPNSKYVKENKEFTYTYTIENTGKISALSNNFEMELPEGISFVKAEYTNNNKKNTVKATSNPRKLKISIYEILAGEKITMTITVKADLLPNKNDKTITTYATLEANGFDKIESNKVNVTIEYDANAHIVKDDDGKKDDATTTSTYKITGTAWLDSNRNGMRDGDEQLLSGIRVILAYKRTSKIVKDRTTNVEKITTTNAQGQYQFDNLLPDEYFVIFDYGNGNYNLTEYRKEGVSETLNSDAIDSTMTLNGVKTIVGISDAIKITNSNVRDIDIGVYKSEKFDLKLDKYITKITRTTPTSGTDVFNYSDEKLTKIEVLKKNLGKSSIVVEYKIVVTNEGAVAGYAKKVVDYLPKGVVFNTELNKDWYLSDNGNVYNTSLENTIIKPGESKELTLVVVKQITKDSIGILNNNAEIYEAYNEQGLKDIDSTPASKQEDEDDMSKADIILGIVTGGQIALYVLITLVVVALLGFGVFEIKKRVLNKK